MPYIVALTGGIGSGKTTISKIFAKFGVPIVDSDVVSKKIINPNTIAFDCILTHFGKHILNKNGYINKKKLREIIFSNIKSRNWINNLLHSLIQKEIKKQIEQIKSSYILWVSPLLIENSVFYLANRILIVDTTKEEQILRTMKRDNISVEQMNNILKSQTSRKKRICYADDIIKNHNNINFNEIINLHKQYLKLANNTL